MPPVATTDRAKAKSRASHGSSASRIRTLKPKTGMPRTGRAVARKNNTMLAMMEARIMLGSGVTKTTKPANARIPAAILIHKPPPSSATTATTRATTMAQLAPETATKWDRDVARIASTNPASTAEVSPRASPGSRRPPSPGLSNDLSKKPTRRASVPERNHPGGVTCVAPSRIINTQPERSPGLALCR